MYIFPFFGFHVSCSCCCCYVFVRIFNVHPYFTIFFIWCFVVNYRFLRAIMSENGRIWRSSAATILDVFHFSTITIEVMILLGYCCCSTLCYICWTIIFFLVRIEFILFIWCLFTTVIFGLKYAMSAYFSWLLLLSSILSNLYHQHTHTHTPLVSQTNAYATIVLYINRYFRIYEK